MHFRFCIVFAAMTALAASAFAQDAATTPVANPITKSERGYYNLVASEVMAAANKMPEANYSFKPTPEVRSFGQLVGHVADAQYMICSMATGAQPPTQESIEKTKTSKADLVAALKEAVGYCNKAYQDMTDAEGSKMTQMMQYKVAKLTVFSINTAHLNEHYGNMVTYLRIKGIVPPSSEKQSSE